MMGYQGGITYCVPQENVVLILFGQDGVYGLR